MLFREKETNSSKNVVVLPGGRYIDIQLEEIPVYDFLTRLHNAIMKLQISLRHPFQMSVIMV